MPSGWTFIAFLYIAMLILSGTSIGDDYPIMGKIINYFVISSHFIVPFFFFLILGRISELTKLVEKTASTLKKDPKAPAPPEPIPPEMPQKGKQETKND